MKKDLLKKLRKKIKEARSGLRIPTAPPVRIFKDKNKYSRKVNKKVLNKEKEDVT